MFSIYAISVYEVLLDNKKLKVCKSKEEKFQDLFKICYILLKLKMFSNIF